MTEKKKAIDQSGISSETRAKLNDLTEEDIVRLKLSGVGGDRGVDASALYIKADYERIVEGSSNTNNAYIVIGRDRRSGRGSGYGGQGDTQCGAIDIVVGRNPNQEVNMERQYVNPDFKKDAARIYISQKTDIDDYFGLRPRPKSTKVSGIGIKADEVRIMARQTLKLVTGVDGHNSRGAKLATVGGIHLIAGNTDAESNPLEPLVKGDQLATLIGELLELIDKSSGVFSTWCEHQTKINQIFAGHTHRSPLFAKPTLFSIQAATGVPQEMMQQCKNTAFDIEMHLFETKKFRINWLEQDRPFLSKKNKTN